MVVTCPNPVCKKRLAVDDALVGKRVSCRACKTAFTVTGPISEAGAGPASRAATAEVHLTADDFDHPPRVTTSAQPGGSRQASVISSVPNAQRPSPVRSPAAGPLIPASPVVPPCLPPPPVGAGNSVNLVVNGLLRALSASKIAYFILGSVILFVSMAATVALLVGIVKVTKSGVILSLGLLGAAVLYVGLIGVLAGGMAHLADMDERGRKAGIGSAFGFCARRFVSLFIGAVLFAIAMAVVLVMVNGLAVLLSLAGTAGSFLAALLFLPQFAIDLALGVALAVWVVVPVAIATENLTALQGTGRFLICLCRDAKRLFAHFAISAAIGMAVLAVLVALFWLPVAMVFATNSPLPSMLGALMELSPDSLMTEDGLAGFYNSGPDLLRGFFGALVGLAIVGYLSAYWVGSFTGYYKDALRRGFRARPRVGGGEGGIVLSCPNPQCGRQLRLKVDGVVGGKLASCPFCRESFVVPPPPPMMAYETASVV